MEATISAWNGMKAAFGRAGRVIEESAEALTVRVDLRGEATHDVAVSRGSGAGQEWVVMRAAVAPTSEMDPWEALAHNSTLAVGALSAANDVVTLRHVAPLAVAHEEEGPALAVRLLAEEASRLRAMLASRITTAARDLFANFGE
ncbi:MAG TPA: hypothetical protein VKE22_12060 [Haliangiales bacterium]|nr:hypothetical protein [Haliangiales bacterium]